MYENFEQIDRVAECFDGSKIFMTGSSGFMGKIFIEKILRLTKVEKIFLLLRGKKEKSPKQRLMEIFEDCLFDTLKQQNSIDEIISKIQLIEGDCSAENLAISPSNTEQLTKNISMIFHFAATIRFTEKFKQAIDLNVRGVRELIKLAESCENLKVFCHISTAYSHLEEKILTEKFYKVPFDPHLAIKLSEGKTEEETEFFFTNFISKNIPNSYVFTKSLAESLIEESKLPILVCRPAIVTACYSEPIPGWIANAAGVTGCVAAGYSGILRTMNCSGENNINLVPVDRAINDIMKSCWDYLKNNHSKNIVNLSYQPMCISNLTNYVVAAEMNFTKTFWHPQMTFVTTKWIYFLRVLLFQWIPAFIMDLVLRIANQKPMFMKAQERISKELAALHPFLNNNWIFSCENLKKINSQLNQVESLRYSSTDHDEEAYTRIFIHGARKFLLKEKDEGIKKAKFMALIFEHIDDILKMAFFAYAFYWIIKVFSFFYRT